MRIHAPGMARIRGIQFDTTLVDGALAVSLC